MTAVSAFAFDLEGTLVDVEEAHHLGHMEVARALGLELTVSEARRTIPGFVGGGDDWIAASLRSLSGTRLALDEVLRMYKAVYLRRLAEVEVAPREGVKQFFQSLEAAGIPFALGSLTPEEEGMRLLERSGLWEVFADRPRIFKEHVRVPKPDPEVFLATARALGVAPARQLVFEDSPVGVLSATRAGSAVIAVPAILDPALLGEIRAAGATAVLLSWVGVGVEEVLGLLGPSEA